MKIYTKAHTHTLPFGNVPVRACIIDDEVWWHLGDISKVLGKTTYDAVSFLVVHRDPKHFGSSTEGAQLRNILFDKTPGGEGTAVGMNHKGLLMLLPTFDPERIQTLAEWLFNKKSLDLLQSHKMPPSTLPTLSGTEMQLNTRSFRGLLFHTYTDEGGEIWWNLQELCDFLDYTQEDAIEAANNKDEDDEENDGAPIIKRVRLLTFNDSNILASNRLGTLLLAGLKPPHRTGKTDGFYTWLQTN